MAATHLFVFVIILFYCILPDVNCHPQCLDFRPPFDVGEELEFCTEYASYGCCNKEMDRDIRSRFTTIMNAIQNDNIQGCGNYVKDILCQECSPYAAHIYDSEQNDERPFPGLCDGYCRDFYAQCISVVPYISSDNQLLSNMNNADMFCSYVALSDVDYCYPELLTNNILNGDISREAITRDGCLCLEPFASGLRNPLSFETPDDSSGRVFVSEQVGVVHIYYKNGTHLDPPFMDITSSVLTSSSAGDERGFLGLTFHPDFKNNRKFYIFFSMRRSNGQHVTRISELLASSVNPNQVDYSSERVLLEIPQPYSNHNGGEILFGVDGYLYLFIGDGGAGGDPRNYAQNKNELLGKVLRIDVDSAPDPGLAYKIPNDNPFVGEQDTRGEIYAYGIRNIWRCDMDDGDPQTGENKGRIICGDVGQNRFEEIDIIEAGGNYGWNLREGFECYRSNPPCDHTGPQVLPIYAYSHSIGKSVTGGHVYRGCMNPNLNGKYIYGDYVAGQLFMLEETVSGWVNSEITMCGSDVCFNGLISDYHSDILSFGEDDDGEVYVLATRYASPTARNGNVYKIVDPRRRGDPSTCKSYVPPPEMTTPSPPDVSETTPDGDGTGNGCLVADITFALDSSGSVTRSGWQKMLQFCSNFLQEVEISTSCSLVSLVTFGTEGYLYSLLNEDMTRDELVSAINGMPFKDEWTNTGASFELMTSQVYVANNGDREGTLDLAIVITDGPSNRRRAETIPNAQMARLRGIDIMTVGVGPYVDQTELQQITNNVDRNLYVNNFDELLSQSFMQYIIDKIQELGGIDNTDENAGEGGESEEEGGPDTGDFSWSCSFEDSAGRGTWCDLTQATGDQFDWTLTRDPTPSDPTGPDDAYSRPYYIFIEATGKDPGDRAILELPEVPSTSHYCLSFAYHMFGWHIDTLFLTKVQRNNMRETIWWQMGEQGRFWLRGSVTVQLSQGEKIAFIGQRGGEYSGDIGLDNIELTTGRC